MRALIDEFRHSPDAIALLVLCLLLGVAKGPVTQVSWVGNSIEMQIHNVTGSARPEAFETLGDRIGDLVAGACDRLPSVDL
jgi:hypothetical protein